ncbi:MAG: hypothetical protein K8F56_02040 [Rhodocyclaceae bacterium]|jgi:hypothetical protein|nr:hypothetical protein [Rhodocyclaceae bacterium]MCC6880468.1 hypothetical protein [Rhodocyclaceae bacterium]
MKRATIAAALALCAAPAAAQQVVELNQVPCQFLESEHGVNHGYKSAKLQDCEAINAKSGQERLAKSKTIALKPGKTVFRVSNKDVLYELGFWLRGATLVSRATLPSVSGGGLTMGKTQDYVIDLKPGEYVYSCPLNPTPDYRLVVK